MHILLFAHNAYTEINSGAARSLRLMMEWLAESGMTCTALGSGRFDQSRDTDIAELNNRIAAADNAVVERDATSGVIPVARFRLRGVDVISVETRGNHRTEDPRGLYQIYGLFKSFLEQTPPDIVLSYSGGSLVQAGLQLARHHGIQTIFTLRALGYDDRALFAHADRVLLNSQMMIEYYGRMIGLQNSAYLPSPMNWREVLSDDDDARSFVTFINPSPHKGIVFFARLAEVLARFRPDIPILVVQSGGSAEPLANTPGLDLARHPQILVSPPIADQRQIYALTKILLVPSVFEEPFGRVAAEAMINGIPPIVSDRGGLPETVGDGGIVLTLPDWITPTEHRIPSPAEVKPWFDAIVRLWTNKAEYDRAASAAKQAAIRLYDERMLKQRYLDYFTAKGPFPPLFAD